MHAILLAAMLSAAAAPSAAPSPDAYQIYTSAMQHLATLAQPDYIDDSQHWSTLTFTNGQQIPGDHFQRTIFDSRNRRECILGVPFDPGQPVVVGDSYFAPDSWLIRRGRAEPQPNEPNMLPDLSDLKTIASVVSAAKPSYDIRLVGTDTLTGGGFAYHLTLRPLFDPVKHNLRELWINTRTNDVMRAIIEGAYRPSTQDVVEDTLVMEDFGQVGKYRLVIHHAWSYVPPFSATKVRFDVTSLTMAFPASLPDWFFDARSVRGRGAEVLTALEAAEVGAQPSNL